MAERRDDRKSPKNDDSQAQTERPDAKTRFARAMARAELGRFYWGASQEKNLQEALNRKPRKR